MPGTTDRQAIHAYLSDESFTAWRDFADESGVSTTSLIETIGLVIRDDSEGWQQLARDLAVIKKARRIDAERRRRGGR